MLDVYTNGFAYDLQQRLAQYGNIPVFGGSSEARFWELLNAQSLPYPSALLTTVQMAGTQESYDAITSDGTWVCRPFDPNTFPFSYAVAARVIAGDPQTVVSVSSIVQSMYANGWMMTFQNPYVQGERIPITLKSAPQPSEVLEMSFCHAQEVILTESGVNVPCFFFPNDVAYVGQSAKIEFELLNIALLCQRAYSNPLLADPHIKSLYWDRKNWICSYLGIPDRVELNIDESLQPRETIGLFSMVQDMLADDSMHVSDAVQFYLMQLEGAQQAAPPEKPRGFKNKINQALESDFLGAVLDRMDEKGTLDRGTADAALGFIKNGINLDPTSTESGTSFVESGINFLKRRK